jgi:hypothetical protein
MLARILLRRLILIAGRHVPPACRESMTFLAALAFGAIALALLEPSVPLPPPDCVEMFADLLESGDDIGASSAAYCLNIPAQPVTPTAPRLT